MNKKKGPAGPFFLYLRKLFHPIEAIAFDEAGNAFEYLIGIEAGNDRNGMPMQNERRQIGEGKHDAPDADDIHT